MTAAGGEVACRWPSCRAPVRVWPTVSGEPLQVDAEPIAAGTVVWSRIGEGWRLRLLDDGEEPAAGTVRFMPHELTCVELAVRRLRLAFPGSVVAPERTTRR